ncbi:uncharacterized protein EKO05_0007472 [Ascochyta rabiei]|uniref:Uncharacterized protein n=1 Tax=Didymella rabiei TaxID=5454 RepID=A0A162YLW8_DIDRA|nr:uncharacterized protein EKO05_0007472 [Ascochyta rabiei]KZM20118.1 hypothetical protein ST47_g8734 [Ascochyta rabiei]UPX17096.1 hypothetical protein EKO05_0007472 [Ascochyta rabiei]
MASTSRANQHPWVTAYQNAPPATCATLRAFSNTVEYGLQCVFAEEDGDPLPNSINTACLPWATSGVPSSAAFYSPATACPTSWTAVATRTAAEGANDWTDGETAIECCPQGFVGGTGGMCNPGSSGTTPVVRCGEADAEENVNLVYTAGSWPASVTARVTALQLRYQPTDIESSASLTGSSSGSTSASTGSSSPGAGNSVGGGLSTGAKAAIGTVVPLVFILGTLAAFLLWRRRRHRKAAVALSKDVGDGHEAKQSYKAVAQSPYNDAKSGPNMLPVAAVAGATQNVQHEAPEWNAELDATEAERRRYMAVQGSLFPATASGAGDAASSGGVSEANELGGMIRMNRKPVAPAELDSTPLTMEMDGDAERR